MCKLGARGRTNAKVQASLSECLQAYTFQWSNGLWVGSWSNPYAPRSPWGRTSYCAPKHPTARVYIHLHDTDYACPFLIPTAPSLSCRNTRTPKLIARTPSDLRGDRLFGTSCCTCTLLAKISLRTLPQLPLQRQFDDPNAQTAALDYLPASGAPVVLTLQKQSALAPRSVLVRPDAGRVRRGPRRWGVC